MKENQTQNAAALPHSAKIKAGSDACTHGVECFTLAWIAGLLAAFLYAAAYAYCLCGGLLLCMCFFRKSRLQLKMAGLFCCGLLLGCASWQIYDHTVRRPLCAMDGVQTDVEGRITDVRRLDGDRFVYTLRTNLEGHRTNIDWYADAETQWLDMGDTVTVEAVVSRITSDYRYRTEKTQAGKGRYLRIYQGKLTSVQKADGFSLARWAGHLREKWTDCIRGEMPAQEAGIFCAMLFGDKSTLSEESADALQKIGIGHVTAVSGLHLVLFCMVLGWLFQCFRFPARLSFCLQVPFIALFILFVDSSVSVYRASIMILLVRSAPLLGRYSNTLRSLCIAILCCTAFSPYVIGSASFWLSVSGVMGIGVIAPYMLENVQCSPLAKQFLQLCCVSVSVFPASILLCGESSLLSPVCNLLILPVCTLILYLGFAFVCTGGICTFLLIPAKVLCRFVRTAAVWCSNLRFSHLTMTEPALRITLIACVIFLVILGIAGCRRKYLLTGVLFSALLLAGMNWLYVWQSRNEIQLAIVGAPRNTAMVLHAEGYTLVEDFTGLPRNAQYVSRCLEDMGVDTIGTLLLQDSRAAAAYQSELSERSLQSVVIMEDHLLRQDTGICGCRPIVCDGKAVVQCGKAALHCCADDTEIIWEQMRICLTEDDTEGQRLLQIFAREGQQQMLLMQVPCDSNLMLRVNRENKIKVYEDFGSI
ncbi:MAG: ComEC/Rec2 family competence protein [Oscillospiraceae bacterium]|nr:ComEC/Rec2 family competence protein [Oscillospiraceae bacterium]